MNGRRGRAILLASCLIVMVACHEEGDVRVAGLAFDGNRAISTSDIQEVVATKAGGRLPWSPAVPFDRGVFQADLERVRQLYEARGYPDARVTALDADLNDAGDAVRLTVVIDEGEPIVVEDLRFVGFEGLSEGAQRRVRGGALQAGEPRDRFRLAETDRIARETLANQGYAYATVDVQETAGTSTRGVVIIVAAEPGLRATFGDISVVGAENLDESIVRRQLTFSTGDMFSQGDVVRSERRLGSLDILQFASINARPPAGPPVERIPVTVTVAEDPLRRLDLRGGYGTEDRVRGSIEWSHLNFLGNARRLTATGRWSSIDRGASLTLMQPHFLRSGLSLDASASSWWTRERIYTSDEQGGRLGVSYQFGGGGRPGARQPVNVVRAAYVVDRMRYTVRPEILEDLTNVEALIALGLDPVTGEGRGTRAAIALDYRRAATDNIANPTRGYTMDVNWEEARPAFGGTFDYRKVVVEGRGYVPLGQTVVATRVRMGTIAAASDADAPFSERFFLGGATSLRGWGRYQVSPLRDGIPVGGRSALDASLELRAPIRDPFGIVLFVDTGNVWSESLSAGASGLRTNVGAGLRYGTPVGLIRADVGYQLNPIDGLVVNGDAESRRWRLHFSIGQAF